MLFKFKIKNSKLIIKKKYLNNKYKIANKPQSNKIIY